MGYEGKTLTEIRGGTPVYYAGMIGGGTYYRPYHTRQRATFWECPYCHTINVDERAKCEYCGAPRTVKPIPAPNGFDVATSGVFVNWDRFDNDPPHSPV